MTTINDIVKQQVHPEWLDFFNSNDIQYELQCIAHTLARYSSNTKIPGYPYFPHQDHLFRAFCIPPSSVKVLILGMDPYPGYDYGSSTPDACGWSFSTMPGRKVPISLQNIYKELIDEKLLTSKPTTGDLTKWVQQGVMLLNMSLTRTPGVTGVAGGHGTLWYGITTKAIKYLSQNTDCIFVLWGNDAKSAKTYIEGNSKILETSHPSGFSARRGFFGCNHFKSINEYLISTKREPINWEP
jgi:uracil-DNA glycosylase